MRLLNGQAILVLLTILGQSTGTIGLPIFRCGASEAGRDVDSACGCCPADREAQRCCCVKPVEPAKPACCSTKPKAVEPASCCSKEIVSASPSPSCCQNPKPTPAKIPWVNPSLRQQCLGPFDSATATSLFFPGLVPDEQAIQADSPQMSGMAELHTSHSLSRSNPPDLPPPRSATV